jgi:hypothetical protein
MIPTRNLLLNKVSFEEKDALIKKVDYLLMDGVSTVFACPEIKEIITIDKHERHKILIKRQAREEVVLSIFSHPPELIATILLNLFMAENELGVTEVFTDKIFAYVRENNPIDFFRYIISMDT